MKYAALSGVVFSGGSERIVGSWTLIDVAPVGLRATGRELPEAARQLVRNDDHPTRPPSMHFNE